MGTNRFTIWEGVLIAMTVLGLSAAVAQSALQPEPTTSKANAAILSQTTGGPSPYSDDEVACRVEGGKSREERPGSTGTCLNCSSDQECIDLGCGDKCAPPPEPPAQRRCFFQ